MVKLVNCEGTWIGGIRAIFSTPTAEKDSMKFCCACLLTVAFVLFWGTYKVALLTATTVTIATFSDGVSFVTFDCCA